MTVPSPDPDVTSGVLVYRTDPDAPTGNAAKPLAALLVELWRAAQAEQESPEVSQ